MAKINKLNSSVILKEYSKDFVQKSITITIGGKDYEVLVDQKFRVTKIQQMLQEALKNLVEFKEEDLETTITYVTFLMIKYFTDVDVAKVEDFKEQIRVLNAMIDLEIFEKIANAFPESETAKVNKHMMNLSAKINEFLKENKNNKNIGGIIESEIAKLEESAE